MNHAYPEASARRCICNSDLRHWGDWGKSWSRCCAFHGRGLFRICKRIGGVTEGVRGIVIGSPFPWAGARNRRGKIAFRPCGSICNSWGIAGDVEKIPTTKALLRKFRKKFRDRSDTESGNCRLNSGALIALAGSCWSQIELFVISSPRILFSLLRPVQPKHTGCNGSY